MQFDEFPLSVKFHEIVATGQEPFVPRIFDPVAEQDRMPDINLVFAKDIRRYSKPTLDLLDSVLSVEVFATLHLYRTYEPTAIAPEHREIAQRVVDVVSTLVWRASNHY